MQDRPHTIQRKRTLHIENSEKKPDQNTLRWRPNRRVMNHRNVGNALDTKTPFIEPERMCIRINKIISRNCQNIKNHYCAPPMGEATKQRTLKIIKLMLLWILWQLLEDCMKYEFKRDTAPCARMVHDLKTIQQSDPWLHCWWSTWNQLTSTQT